MTLAFPHTARRTLTVGRPDRPAPNAARDPAPDRTQEPLAGRMAEQAPVHDARGLTGRDGTARILLDGQVYCLRITRAGKLILTK